VKARKQKKAPKAKLKKAKTLQGVKPLTTYIGETEKNIKQVF
jgi:hypothetical protein